MSYPNFKNKHKGEPLISAVKHFRPKYITRFSGHAPTKYILVYYPYLKNHFIRKYKPKIIKTYRLITIYQYNDIALVQLTGVGCPNAVQVVEEIIALGGKEFINIGSAGGLDGLGVFVCNKAIRDEGTSHHYVKYGKYAYPDSSLTKKLILELNKQKIKYSIGTTWTIDAPYMETSKEIIKYKKEGVKTVEMESSALFVLGKVRKVKVSAMFVVSDELGNNWKSHFGKAHVHNSLKELVDIAVKCYK